MTREIIFTPAFHKCKQKPGDPDLGIGSAMMRWILKEHDWAITWDTHTHWGLPRDAFDAACPGCTHPRHQNGYPADPGLIPLSAGVTWHSPVPLFKDSWGPSSDNECEHIGAICYLDVGYVISDHLFELLCIEGSDAVWEKMSEWLNERRDEVLHGA